jgi:hypothetical protein
LGAKDHSASSTQTKALGMGQALVGQFGLIYRRNHLHYLNYEVREEKVGVDMVNPNPVHISITKSQNKIHHVKWVFGVRKGGWTTAGSHWA